jgi:chromosomal replication initiator protein
MTTTIIDPRDIWDAALGELQLRVTRANYETWLKHTVGVDLHDGEFVIGAPNAFVLEALEQRMFSLISETVEHVLGEPVNVAFRVTMSPNGADAVGAKEPVSAPSSRDIRPAAPEQLGLPPYVRPIRLNAKYTFDRFVVGRSNELAHAAAEAVAAKPGSTYNPLVMYSGVGLGKTHLLHGIGHRAIAMGLSVIYATTEEFTNDYIKAIREGTTEEFRDHYRNADMLLLDDIQFLIGKEQTQEGFFHTFNALHMANRQIVVTSDRPVSALRLLEDRIQSRLTGGLVVDMQPPAIETRLAILKVKAEQAGHDVPDTVLELLAERVYDNVRELEGSLNRVIALAHATDSPINVDLVARAIDDMVDALAIREVPPDVVLDTVAAHFGMGADALTGRKRDKKTALARHVAMYLLREDAKLRLTAIGRVLGGKDHTTVGHGCDRIAVQLGVDSTLRRQVANIRETLAAS